MKLPIGQIIVWAILAGACSTDGGSVSSRAAPATVRVSATKMEWSVNKTFYFGDDGNLGAMRAGLGLVTVLIWNPAQHRTFQLTNRATGVGSGGPVRPVEAPESILPDLGSPSDVIGIGADSKTWFLDGETGRVVGQDIGGRRELLVQLKARGKVLSACKIDEATVAFADADLPQTVLVQSVAAGATPNAYELPGGFLRDHPDWWHSVQFAGSMNGPCVLWSARVNAFLMVGRYGVAQPITFVPSVSRELAKLSGPARLVPSSIRDNIWPKESALDITTFPTGIAVLRSGATLESDRLLDIYSFSGRHVEVVHMPRGTRRVSADGARIISVLATRDSVYLASSLMPAHFWNDPAPQQVKAPTAADMEKFLLRSR